MRIMLALGLALSLAGPAMGEDLNPPPWDLSLPNQTAEWWECEGQPVYPFEPIWPTQYDNPFGPPEPTLTFLCDVEIEYIPGPHDPVVEIATWHVSGPGGIDIEIKNNPDPDKYKLIFWQITSDQSPTPTGSPPTTTPPGTSLPSPYPQAPWPVDNWYTYNGLLEIRPNPEKEIIHFDLLPSTNIEEIVIKTICIPEPATLTLLALGACLPLLRRRRK